MKNVKIDEDQVTTLKELATKLAGMYGWTSYEADGGEIRFENGDGKKHRADTSGFAQTLEDGEWVDDDELNVDWDEDFDAWSNHVWAEDENGETVMLHD